jgi:hypothetical protein
VDGGQSSSRIVHIDIDVKSWISRLPTVDDVRPGSCPRCGAASRPAGGSIVLQGHGLRRRDQWGPPDASGPPEVGEITGRRYRCTACRALLLVLPRGVLPRQLYSAAAVALALALWGVEHLAPAKVRARVSPWRIVGAAAAGGWAALRRWAKAVRAGAIFGCVRGSPEGARLREVAGRAATTLAAHAPATAEALPMTTRAFVGAAHVS